jgi:magnesium-transporting ATPase (P-type)
VTRGNGRGVVIALGEETEYGEILKQRFGQVKYEFPSLIIGCSKIKNFYI